VCPFFFLGIDPRPPPRDILLFSSQRLIHGPDTGYRVRMHRESFARLNYDAQRCVSRRAPIRIPQPDPFSAGDRAVTANKWHDRVCLTVRDDVDSNVSFEREEARVKT